MNISQKWLEGQLEYVYQKVLENLDTFETLVPAAVSKDYVYPAVENADWTDGFWTGILHLANSYRPNEKIQTVITKQLAVFQKRLDEEIVLNHHDLGFLYSLSAVADYRLNKNESSKKMALQAADVLMRRYDPVAKVIQAWGDKSDPNQQGRMIIDCNMNLALLYFASLETHDSKYYEAAKNHVKRAQKYLVRPDFSTFHTYYMDVKTGLPRFGQTAQGYSDDSCWARGQAWGIYGFPISYRYTGDASLLQTACDVTDYFLAHLPADKVSYWDLVFEDGSPEERDTSAAAIAVSGLIELSQCLPLSDPRRQQYEKAAEEIIFGLGGKYTTKGFPESNGFLTQGVYSKPGGNGVDECTTWGDYFYFEALLRMYQSWQTFW